jgi:phage tail-like protein
MKSRIARRSGLLVAAAIVAVGVGVVAPTVFGAGAPPEPLTAARFSLTVNGAEIGQFSELSGIVTEVEPSEYWDTNGQGQVKKLPGKLKPPTITLKRGMTSGLELWAWHEAVRAGDLNLGRKSVTLTMYNTVGEPVAKYFLTNAYPAKLEISALKAGASEVLVETVTLTAERLQRLAAP